MKKYNIFNKDNSFDTIYACDDEKMIENVDENINKLKNKKRMYMASTFICGVSGIGAILNTVSQKDENNDNIEDGLSNKTMVKAKDEIEKYEVNNENLMQVASEIVEESIEVVDVSSKEPTTEDELKIAIDIAKESLKSYENNKVEEDSVGVDEGYQDSGLNDSNIDFYSYNLEEQLGDKNNFVDTGKSKTSNSVANAMRYWNYFEYYGYTYGVDPYLLVAVAAQESSGDHESTIEGGARYKGAGYGIMQIEKPGEVTKRITAFNHVTKSYEIMNIESTSDISNVGLNIKAGAMQLAQRFKEQKYNPYVTLQGYNYGSSGIKYALSYYIANGDDNRVEEIYSFNKGEHVLYYISLNDNKWVDTILPSGLTCREWYSSTGWRKFGAGGGDKNYIENVMRFYKGEGRPYILNDAGGKIEF